MKYNFSLDLHGNNSLSKIIPEIRSGSLVLEFGPANGRLTRYLKEELSCKVYAVEIDAAAAKDAAPFAEKILVDDIEGFRWTEEFKDIAFDYIIFADVLEHLYHPSEVLKAALKLLQEEGTILVSVPNIAHNSILLNLFCDRFEYTGTGLLDDTHIRFFTYNSLHHLFYRLHLLPVLEDAVYLPVGENEVSSSYEQVAPEVGQALQGRLYGNVYQFIFALKKDTSQDYIIRRKIKPCFPPCRYAEFLLDTGLDFNELERLRIPLREDGRQRLTVKCSDYPGLQGLKLQVNERLLLRFEGMELFFADGTRKKADRKSIEHNADYILGSTWLFLKNDAELLFLSDDWQGLERLEISINCCFLTEGADAFKPDSLLLQGIGEREQEMQQEMQRELQKALKKRPLLVKAADYLQKNGWRATLKRIYWGLRSRDKDMEDNLLNFKEVGILTTRHCCYIARLLQHSLKQAGIASFIIFEEPLKGYRRMPHFVICPQMFKRLPDLYIAVQMEQSVSSRWFNRKYLEILEHSFAVLDYSLLNIEFLQKKGLSMKQLYYMPIDFLPGEVAKEPEEKLYDVLFYGDVNNERRKRFIAEIEKHYQVKVINNLFGEELYAELRRARIVLNIHYYENALLETTRIYECLSLKSCLVISEKSQDLPEYEGLEELVDFVDIDDTAQMISRIDFWLKDLPALERKLAQNAELLAKRENKFEYYFCRFLLANDLMDFDEFYRLNGDNIRFAGDRICLGLPESYERKREFAADNAYGFEYFPGLRHRIGWVGCGMSYKFIIKKAAEQGLGQVAVCEDDVLFPEGFKARLAVVESYLKERTDGWHVFSGLIADGSDETAVEGIEEFGGEEFISVNRMVSMVFNIYHRDFYEYLLRWDEGCRTAETNTIDRFLERQDGLKILTTLPFLTGHKEELYSTLWGAKNKIYTDLIAGSSKLLAGKAEEYKKRNGLIK